MEFAAQLVLVRQEADDRADSSSTSRVAGHGFGEPPPAALVAQLPMLPNEG